MRSAVLPSVHPKDEKPTTEIATAPITAPQIPGFRLGNFFICRASVSGGEFPPDLAAANRGPERELVCYPTGHLGLRLIDHTSFRGTEFCAADQFSTILYCVFFSTRKRFLNIFLRICRYAIDFISYAFFSDRLVSGKIYGRSTSSIERNL